MFSLTRFNNNKNVSYINQTSDRNSNIILSNSRIDLKIKHFVAKVTKVGFVINTTTYNYKFVMNKQAKKVHKLLLAARTYGP